MRRTKIIATLGPACSSEEIIYRLLNSGVDVFRLNFSHGTHEQHEAIIRLVREASMAIGRYVPIVGDIQGPKLRIGDVDGEGRRSASARYVAAAAVDATRPLRGAVRGDPESRGVHQ